MAQAERNALNNEFSYLLDKIEKADIKTDPFKHLEIKNFLSEEHFDHIQELNLISTSGKSDKDLISSIQQSGYSHVRFPGTFDSVEEYISHRQGKSQGSVKGVFNTINNKGIVFRLDEYKDPVLNNLFDLFRSREFVECVCNKFELDPERFDTGLEQGEKSMSGIDTGLQKYLDGYEISPHPDIRKKALTWMLNLNPSSKSAGLNHHTHYLELEDEYKYIEEFWKYNTSYDTCWVPWEWCNTVKRQTENNSIVFFSPSYDTIHGVKADYNHLETQRTQFYGNLWYDNIDVKEAPEHDDLVIKPKSDQSIINIGRIKQMREKIEQGVENPSQAIKHLIN
ncbi:hypothetical protein [Halobellus sp. GM3]|uniref:hypothetical protein n=1 Tax=Halobellus sp. GM3 TaxID=3458410 RepID=UPI00403DD0C7